VLQETDLATRLIDSPLIAILVFSVAFAVATILVRSMPSIGRTLTVVEASWQSAIDGLRGMLGVSVDWLERVSRFPPVSALPGLPADGRVAGGGGDGVPPIGRRRIVARRRRDMGTAIRSGCFT